MQSEEMKIEYYKMIKEINIFSSISHITTIGSQKVITPLKLFHETNFFLRSSILDIHNMILQQKQHVKMKESFKRKTKRTETIRYKKLV